MKQAGRCSGNDAVTESGWACRRRTRSGRCSALPPAPRTHCTLPPNSQQSLNSITLTLWQTSDFLADFWRAL